MAASAVLRGLGQIAAYAAFAAVVVYFSAAPAYRYIAPDQAVVKLTLAHYGERLQPCRRRSAEEIAELPPNMRRLEECPRERSPITVELQVDGRVVHHEVAPPTGLWGDGMAYVYRRFTVPAGDHRLTARLRDSVHVEGYNHERSETLRLTPGEALIVEFDARRGFIFQPGGGRPGTDGVGG